MRKEMLFNVNLGDYVEKSSVVNGSMCYNTKLDVEMSDKLGLSIYQLNVLTDGYDDIPICKCYYLDKSKYVGKSNCSFIRDYKFDKGDLSLFLYGFKLDYEYVVIDGGLIVYYNNLLHILDLDVLPFIEAKKYFSIFCFKY